MGQNLSADATEVVHFRKMVKHTFHGNVAKLETHFYEASMAFQISRAAYIDVSNRIEGRIESIHDSRRHEAKLEKHLDEKQLFFAAVEDGRIVLGDTLLHVAVRLGHVEVVLFLLSMGLRENVPNFRGQFAHECCKLPSIQVLMDDVVLVHDVLGFDYDDEPRVHRLVDTLRTLWPLWMYDASEAGPLVQVVSDTRTSHLQYAKLVKIAATMASRYRTHVTLGGLPIALELLRAHDRQAYDAKRAFHKLPTPEKLQVVWDILGTYFPRWKHLKSVEKDAAYLAFIEDAMGAWITIADDLRLYLDDATLPTDADVLQALEPQVWKRRLAPPPDAVEDLCAHISGVEKVTGLKHLHIDDRAH
ncbi:hypothetical protein SDRG_02756 [Saprolegnia diclina VS20]|uniref:Uncharacterized protein n=1 Tax=Saprolegnia diclina (strain VS20) TaxID=1156394 RepID=T0S4U7_SAPDV|nr:hypothetical protein SDRG_02756 [Saprolegnia diclina VS20]EQC40103.1 hypothetical protein SDRG_02756 [Saprolegnia diclina VS20]|eukprot:XP_008606577.1 hypothetical protein SDRG_02756 [Saprolegnia diclina VS20]